MNYQEQAAQAEAKGFPHEGSVRSRTNRMGVSEASREEVERYFSVPQTGKDRRYHTVMTPKRVTDEMTDLFNRIFGRSR